MSHLLLDYSVIFRFVIRHRYAQCVCVRRVWVCDGSIELSYYKRKKKLTVASFIQFIQIYCMSNIYLWDCVYVCVNICFSFLHFFFFRFNSLESSKSHRETEKEREIRCKTFSFHTRCNKILFHHQCSTTEFLINCVVQQGLTYVYIYVEQ